MHPRPTWGVAAAAVAALAAAAGLAWWFSLPDTTTESPRPVPEAVAAPAGPPLRYAEAEPDPELVRHAWRDVQATYADGGASALGRASADCTRRLPAQPALLDYCLALDAYAAAIVPVEDEAWLGDTRERDLTLARMFAPAGADPAARVALVRALTRTVASTPAPKPTPQAARTVQGGAVAPSGPAPQKARAPARRGERHAKTKAKLARVAAGKSQRSGRGAGGCESRPTEADRLVCANSELAAADRRMKSAYNEAIASGVDPAELGRDQETWRLERDRASDGRQLRDLYRERIEELENLAPPH